MKTFLAKNPKQLDICLKMLYSEHVTFTVMIKETEKKRIEYDIIANTDEEVIDKLLEKYRILIS